MELAPLLALVGLAGAVAALVAGLVSWGVSRWGPVDRPRERGMHASPTPTSGGLAVMAGVGAAVWLLPPLTRVFGLALAETLGLAVVLGLFGAVDDAVDLPARVKLLLQLLVILAVAFAVPPPPFIALTDTLVLPLPGWLGSLGVALWILVVLNAVNFMDGANGLVAGSMAVVLLAFGMVMIGGGWAVVGVVWVAAAAALAGFLPFNFPKARLFQGDAGALFVAGLAAASWILVIKRQPQGPGLQLLALPIALAPVLTDVLLTLLARARRKARLMDAHREHLYQRWLARHGDHAALARRMWSLMAVFALVGAMAAVCSAAIASLLLLASVAACIAGWTAIDRGLRANP